MDKFRRKADGEEADRANRDLHLLWEQSFSRLLDYVKLHGHARVPQSYHDDEGNPVGPWVVQQRVDHNTGEISADHQHRLQDLPGWTWDASST